MKRRDEVFAWAWIGAALLCLGAWSLVAGKFLPGLFLIGLGAVLVLWTYHRNP